MTVSQVSEKGQITLPARARRALGIQPRDRVSIELVGDGILIKPVANFFHLEGALGKAVSDEEEQAAAEATARNRLPESP